MDVRKLESVVMMNYKSELAKRDYRTWSKDAINCYERKCHCEGCPMYSFCYRINTVNFYKIQPMKYSVLMLYARHGAPKKRGDWSNEDNSERNNCIE